MKFPWALSFLLAHLGVLSAPGQTFSEFPIPSYGQPHPAWITTGPDGNLWFTLQTTPADPYVCRITPEGEVTQFPIPTIPAGAQRITTGPDGNLWFTEVIGNHVSRVTTSGSVTEFPIPTIVSEPDGIATGPDGALWFTESSGNRVGRITTSGVITEFVIPGLSVPAGIVAGPDGALWFADPHNNRIVRITTSGAITAFPIPTLNAGPLSITVGPDGALWFTESSANKIGRMTTGGTFSEFPISTPGSQPYGLAAGLDGNLYFTEATGNKIGRITTSGTITEFPIPTAASGPQGIAWGPDGAIWFTEFDGGKIGRMSLGPLTCEPDTTTLCLNAGRFRVTAEWRSLTDAGTGTAVPLTNDSGYFWFFGASNIEVLVKALDGCSFNSRYWVFAAGLTDVEVTLRIIDTQTGALRTYVNPRGTPFQPVQDTSAFATRPLKNLRSNGSPALRRGPNAQDGPTGGFQNEILRAART